MHVRSKTDNPFIVNKYTIKNRTFMSGLSLGDLK
jgi:hypothetical protein